MVLAGLFAVLVGFVSAGFVGSLWALISGHRPVAGMMLEQDLFLPLRVLVVVLHAPILLLRRGGGLVLDGRTMGLATLAFAILWCLMQGVFILTALFRIG